MMKKMIVWRKRGSRFLSSDIMSRSSFEISFSLLYFFVLFCFMLEVAVLFGFTFAYVCGCHVRCQDILSVESFWSSRARTGNGQELFLVTS
jgi:hypothetical protein